MRRDGTGARRLTRSPALDSTPAWSPDGRRIVFYSDRTGDDEVWVMNADGTGQHRITRNGAADGVPDWGR